MQYIFDGEFYKVARVTGPTHNMLAVKFSNSTGKIKMVDLNYSDQQPNIFADEVKNQVELGLKEINCELGTQYKISVIQFIGSDSKSNSVYRELVKAIVNRLESGNQFNEK